MLYTEYFQRSPYSSASWYLYAGTYYKYGSTSTCYPQYHTSAGVMGKMVHTTSGHINSLPGQFYYNIKMNNPYSTATKTITCYFYATTGAISMSGSINKSSFKYLGQQTHSFTATSAYTSSTFSGALNSVKRVAIFTSTPNIMYTTWRIGLVKYEHGQDAS